MVLECQFPLKYRKKSTRLLANIKCIVVEPIECFKLRTIIPLNQVISIRPCYCKRKSKHLTCDCFRDNSSASTVVLTSASATPSTSDKQYNHQQLTAIRIYYAVAVGEHRWKVTFIHLNTQDNDNENETDYSKLFEWINGVSALLEEFERPKKLLVFVNPIGGKRKAGKIYDTKVAPILHLAGIQVEHIVTQRANHARDLLADTSHPIKDYDGFVCVGGDGMFAELLNGILERTQKENNIECNQVDARLARPSIPIGVIPAGSTDAVAFSVTGTNDPVTSTVHIIFGKRIDIDVSSIHNAREDDRLIRYATSFLAYGFFGDVLLDSESNRWMGPKRYDWAGLKKFLGHKLYEGEIKLFISTADGSPKDTNICQAECPLCAKSGLRDRYGMSDNMKRTNETNANNEELENVPPASEQTCITIRGRFLAINSATMTCRCDKAKKGISPSAHLGNGCSDLIIVSQCSRINYLRYLARTGWLSASPFELPFVDVYRVREFEFTPIVSSNVMKNSNGQSSVWNCDGEVITDPAVRVKVHCQLLPVFGTGRENRITNKATMGYAGYRKVRDMNENRTELDYSNGNDTAHPPIMRT